MCSSQPSESYSGNFEIGSSEFPLIGRIVPEIGDERIRERFIYSYRMVYRVDSVKVLIVAVIHGKRLLENIAERLEAGT